MDFPIKLNSGQFVNAMPEFKQDIELLLREPIKYFLQSAFLGAKFDIHCGDEQLVETGIRDTVNEMRGAQIVFLEVSLPNVNLGIQYYDEIIKFQFSVKDYENALTNNPSNS